MQNQPSHILIHCSASAWGNAQEIDRWHKARGWAKIGYHFVVLNGRPTLGVFQPELDGAVESGREPTAVGAHCPPYNARSLAICLIGDDNKFTSEQLARSVMLTRDLCLAHNIPVKNVLGHREADPSSPKLCPTLDMEAFRACVATAIEAKHNG